MLLCTRVVCLAYVAAILGAWMLCAYGADRHWLGTVLAFGPRWVLLMPLGVLVPATAWGDRRSLWLLAAAGVAGAGPMSGLCLSVRSWGAGEEPTIRVLTLNTDGRADVARLSVLIDQLDPDVVALQECGPGTRYSVIFDADWHVHQAGELLVASRLPIESAQVLSSPRLPSWRRPALHCRLMAAGGAVDFVNVHLYTPRDGLAAVLHARLEGVAELEANTRRRRAESRVVAEWIERLAGPVIVAGDFNQPVESRIHQESFGRYENAFGVAGWGWGGTFSSRWHSVRIDHVLASRRGSTARCWVGPHVGSAHRPLVADIATP
jgi:endonuclease/exonuclease/phosphatase family metal-dependent hydrolase